MLDLSRHVVIDLARFRHDRRQPDVTDKWTLKKACFRHAVDRFTCKIVKFFTYFTYLCLLFVDDVIAKFVFPFDCVSNTLQTCLRPEKGMLEACLKHDLSDFASSMSQAC